MTDLMLPPASPPLVAVPEASGLGARALFVREFVRAPLRTASLLPSSRTLAARMTRPARQEQTSGRVVVELGPGTGAFSTALAQQLQPGDRHLAIELNPVMAAHLRTTHPTVEVVTGGAAELPQLLAERGIEAVDLVVSGLPWQAFSGPTGRQLIGTVAGALAPTGTFTQFTYSWTRWAPPARRQLAQLRAAFGSVEISPTIWRNFPPAFVYTARRPRGQHRCRPPVQLSSSKPNREGDTQ